VLLLASGTVTIRATQDAAGGFASANVQAAILVAPRTSNNLSLPGATLEAGSTTSLEATTVSPAPVTYTILVNSGTGALASSIVAGRLVVPPLGPQDTGLFVTVQAAQPAYVLGAQSWEGASASAMFPLATPVALTVEGVGDVSAGNSFQLAVASNSPAPFVFSFPSSGGGDAVSIDAATHVVTVTDSIVDTSVAIAVSQGAYSDAAAGRFYAASSSNLTFTALARIDPQLTFQPPSTDLLAGSTIDLAPSATSLSSSATPITFQFAEPLPSVDLAVTLSGSELMAASGSVGGTCTVTAILAASAGQLVTRASSSVPVPSYTGASKNAVFTIEPQVTFFVKPEFILTQRTLSSSSAQVSVATNSTGAITYEVSGNDSASVDATGLVRFARGSSTVVTANLAQSGMYASASATITIQVNVLLVAIIFMHPANVPAGGSVQLEASSNSPAPVVFALDAASSLVASIDMGILNVSSKITSNTIISVTATQAEYVSSDNTCYSSADDVATFNILAPVL